MRQDRSETLGLYAPHPATALAVGFFLESPIFFRDNFQNLNAGISKRYIF